MFKLFICFIAGLGAGLGTGFAGMSAAAVISPMLITFLGLPAYEAVGIALASDVLASAVSAYTYGKNKNLDIRNGGGYDGCGFALYVSGKFCGKPGAQYDNGQFFRIYDAAAWD